MKAQYKVALGVVAASWLATGGMWLQQKTSRAAEERLTQDSVRTLQNSNQPQWGGMRHRWVNVPEARKKALTACITEQLNAFRRDDYTSAAQYQSAALRQNFSSTAMFRAIIRRSYPEFADYKSVSFGRARMDPNEKRFAVMTIVTGRTGRTSRVIYFMVNEDEKYLVDGVARARDRGRFSGPPGGPGRPPGASQGAPPRQPVGPGGPSGPGAMTPQRTLPGAPLLPPPPAVAPAPAKPVPAEPKAPTHADVIEA